MKRFKDMKFGTRLLLLAGAGVLLGVLTAILSGFIVHWRINRDSYSIAENNGYSGNPDGDLLPALGLQYDASEIAEKVEKSVVTLIAYDIGGMGYGFGSGVLFKEDEVSYYILTNGHVVDNSEAVTVYFTGAIQPEVEVLGYDMGADAALVRLYKNTVTEEIMNGLELAVIGDSDELRAGDFIVTLGTPSEITYRNTITAGIISGLNRTVTINGYDRNYIQTDATINPGNSGGAMFNENAELVGITAAKIIASNIEGISFALPINAFLDVVNQYMP